MSGDPTNEHRRAARDHSAPESSAPPTPPPPPPPPKPVLAFAAIYIIWGSTYLAIRWGVEGMPPLLMAGTRFVLAGGLMYAWVVVRPRSASAGPNGTGAGGPARSPSALAQWGAALLLGGL